jgi:predicted MFS family arabinose efflux permease
MADKPTSVVAAILLGCVGVLAIMAQPILTAALVGQMGMDPGRAGGVSAAEALGTALGPVAALFWMRRVPWRSAALFALVVVIGGNLLSAMQTDFRVLVPLRLAIGFFGEGTAFALAVAIVSSTQQKDRNFAFMITAQVVLGVVMFLALPWPADAAIAGVMLPLAGFALLALGTTFAWLEQPTAAGGHHAAAGRSGSARQAISALVVMLVWCSGLGAVWAFVKLLGTAGGLEAPAVGQALGLTTALGTLGSLAASALSDRFGRLLPVSIALLVQAAMASLLHGPMSWLQFVAICATFQIFWNMTGPYLMGTVALSDATGKVSVLIPTAQIGGFFLGPVIVSWFLTEGSYRPVNYVGAACILLALVLFIPAASRLKVAPANAGH